MPIFFHNSQNYNINLFEKQLINLANRYSKEHIFHNIILNCIPRSNSKFISFSVKFPYKLTSDSPMLFFEIRFFASMQFISGSLDAISNNYSNDFKITRSNFPEESCNLISQNEVLPYNYLDNFEKLNETKLPNIEEFYDIP